MFDSFETIWLWLMPTVLLAWFVKSIFDDGKPERDHRRFQEETNARFEKNVKMATDATNEVQREMGFVVLGQMFSTNGENFDALTEENKALLEYLISKNPMMTEAQREACKELYRQRRVLEAAAKKAKEA